MMVKKRNTHERQVIEAEGFGNDDRFGYMKLVTHAEDLAMRAFRSSSSFLPCTPRKKSIFPM
jgi:hypothetical protein